MSLRSPRWRPRLTITAATAFLVGVARGNVSAAPMASGAVVDASRAWWLLLPATLAVGCWWWLNAREEPIGQPVVTLGRTTTPAPPTAYRAEAASREGRVAFHQRPDPSAPVLRDIRNGAVFTITGQRRRDATREEWLEVSEGGWVRDSETRYDRNIVR